MFGVTTSDDYRPVTWMGRYPVDVTTLLVVAHVAAMVIGCLLLAFGAGGVLFWLSFNSDAVVRGHAFHQLITYAFVHPPAGLLGFAIEMYVLFIFGREVERFVGRNSFIALYSILLLGPSVILLAWGWWRNLSLAGSTHLHFAIFIAFATIYPRAELIFRILAKWAAFVFIAISTLQYLAYHEWPNLVVSWFSIGVAFLFIELRGAGPELAWLKRVKNFGRRKPRLHVVQKSSTRRVVEPEDVYASVDPILDKIAKSGIGSLTPSERRALDRARARLLKADSD
jgi:hypothetical protein